MRVSMHGAFQRNLRSTHSFCCQVDDADRLWYEQREERLFYSVLIGQTMGQKP